MFEIQVLIPVVDNAGVVFTAEEHLAFEAVLIERFGGFTLYPANAVGGWFDAKSGITYRDHTRMYGVAVGSIVDAAKVTDVVRFAQAHYRQEAIFVRYLGQVEILDLR